MKIRYRCEFHIKKWRKKEEMKIIFLQWKRKILKISWWTCKIIKKKNFHHNWMPNHIRKYVIVVLITMKNILSKTLIFTMNERVFIYFTQSYKKRLKSHNLRIKSYNKTWNCIYQKKMKKARRTESLNHKSNLSVLILILQNYSTRGLSSSVSLITTPELYKMKAEKLLMRTRLAT